MRAGQPLAALAGALGQMVVQQAEGRMRAAPAGLDVDVLVAEGVVQPRGRGGAGELVGHGKPHRGLAAQLRIGGVPAAFGVVLAREIDEDGLRVAQQEAVVVDHRKLAQRIDLCQERGRPVLAARMKVDRHALVLDAEPGKHLPHLEAVARQGVVVEPDHVVCLTPKRMPRSRSQRR